MHPWDQPVLFFDGVCGLCDGLVQWTIRRDFQGRIRFAAIQSLEARSFLISQGIPPAELDALETVYFYDTSVVRRRSDAILGLMAELPLPWRGVRILKFIPRVFRDGMYRFVSRTRYRIFGKRDACRIPGESERERFLF